MTHMGQWEVSAISGGLPANLEELAYMPIVHITGNQRQKTALPIKGLQSTFSETETPMGQLVLGRCGAGSKLTVFNISTKDPN